MEALIERYIEDQKYAWAETTQRSERHRLASVERQIDNGVDAVWISLAGLKPYSRVQTWNRICHFIDWCIENGHRSGPNEFKQFRKKNARQFKHVYERRVPTVTYHQARKLIEGIEDEGIREKCLELLGGALRWIDSARREGEFTRGKGGKLRRVYAPESRDTGPVGYDAVYRTLKKLGLTPHQLRKIRLNHLKDKGATIYELMEIAGWQDPKTAMAYLKASEENIQKLMID